MKLKNKIVVIVIALVLAAFATVAAIKIFGNKGVSVSYPKGFIEITDENTSEHADFIKALGYTEESFANHLSSNGIISFSANADNSSQFTLSCRESDLSRELKDITNATDSELQSISKALLKDGHSAVRRIGGRTYLEVNTTVAGENGYSSRQHITIVDGKYYSLNYYGSATDGIEPTEAKIIEKTLESLVIPEQRSLLGNLTDTDATRVFYMILSTAVGIAGMVVIVLLSISLVRDYLKKRRSNDADSIHIKRRK